MDLITKFKTLWIITFCSLIIFTLALIILRIDDEVSVQGTIQPKFYTNIYIQQNSTLKNLFFKVGETVKEGDVIAIFNNPILNEKILSLESELSEKDSELEYLKQSLIKLKKNPYPKEFWALSAQAEYISKETDYWKEYLNIQRKLFDKKSISKNTLDKAELNLNDILKQSEIINYKMSIIKNGYFEELILEKKKQINWLLTKKKSITKQLNFLQKQKNELIIKSKTTGLLYKNFFKEGMLCKRGDLFLSIAKMDYFNVEAYISENDVLKVRQNQHVHGKCLQYKSIDDGLFEGVVTKIYPSTKVKENKSLYKINVDIKSFKQPFTLGSSVNLKIFSEQNIHFGSWLISSL